MDTVTRGGSPKTAVFCSKSSGCSRTVRIVFGVAEHSQGRFLVERCCFTALDNYFTKTHVLRREDDNPDAVDIDTGVDIENPDSGTQTTIFEMLEDSGRLCRRGTEEDLVDCAETPPRL